MPAFQFTESFLPWLWRASWQASLLTVLVLLVQWIFQSRLGPKWRYALWSLVVIRLLLPATPRSPLSLFNYASVERLDRSALESWTRGNRVSVDLSAAVDSALGTRSTASSQRNLSVGAPEPVHVAPSLPVSRSISQFSQLSQPSFVWRRENFAYVWLLGTLALGMRLAWGNYLFALQLRRRRPISDPAVLAVLDQCREVMNVRKSLVLLEAPELDSPALFGCFRLRLLLPEKMTATFSADELRYVFLHELAHIRRGDAMLNWLLAVLQILHWFNPVLWFGFRRLRADRELACDELALARADEADSTPYGRTIIKVLEGFTQSTAIPGLVGILEDKQQMKRRITMIAQFKKMTQWSAVAFTLLLTLGLVTLTDAQTDKETAGFSPTRDGGQKITIVASGTEQHASGDLSPDETAVAYIDWKTPGGDIAVRDLSTGKSRTLTDGAGGKEYSPGDFVWSPDSKSIAYWWWQSPGGVSLRIVSRDGGGPRSVALSWDKVQANAPKEDHASFNPEDWTRDGALLVGQWELADGSSALATLAVATGEVRVIGSYTPKAGHPRFSPDGRFIVYERIVDGNRDVYLTRIDGTQTVRVTDSPVEEGKPVFSPDGRYVLLSSNQRGGWDLWAIPVENGHPIGSRFLVKADFGDNTKRITTAGKLAFTTASGGNDVFELDTAAPGGGPKAIARASFGRNLYPTWSPDGKKIAYARRVGGWDDNKPWLLCVQSLADGREDLYETGMRIADWMFWAPDGETLVIGGEHEDGKTGMYVFSLSGRQRVSARIRDLNSHWPLGFSTDAKEFVFLKAFGSLADLWKVGLYNSSKERIAVDLKTGTERKMSPPEELARFAADRTLALDFNISRDGTSIAYVVKEGKEQQLVVTDADYRQKRVIARVTEPATIRSPSWSPDGKRVAYYVKGTDDKKQQLHVAAADGTASQLLHEGNFWHVKIGPRWSPDGAKIGITLHEESVAEIGVLENFLPKEKLAVK